MAWGHLRGMSVDKSLELRIFALRANPYLERHHRAYLCAAQGKLLNREPGSPRSKWERATGSTKVGYGGRLRGFRQASFVKPAWDNIDVFCSINIYISLPINHLASLSLCSLPFFILPCHSHHWCCCTTSLLPPLNSPLSKVELSG